MDHIEMVESLCQKADVSISEAKDALERANWDILEAMILLENDGKTEKGTTAASSTSTSSGEKYEIVQATASSQERESSMKRMFGNFKDGITTIAKFLCRNSIIVRRKGNEIASLPLILLIIFFCASPQWVLGLLFVGLFIGCGYYIEGMDFKDDSRVNQVMSEINDSFDHMMNNKKDE